MPLEKFCPKCGKQVEELIEGLCYHCYSIKRDLVEIPETISLAICKCGRGKELGEWKHYETFDRMINEIVTNNVKTEKNVSLNISFQKKPISGKITIPVKIEGTKKSGDTKIKQETRTLVTITPQVCDHCGKQRGNYYEGIIQIRGNKTKQEELRNFIFSFIETRIGKEGNAFITKEEKLKEGTDIYIGSIKLANKVMSEAKKKFDLETNETYKLAGEKDGKVLKRATVLLRLL